MYDQSSLNQSERLTRNRHPVGSRGCDAIGSEAPLGIITKSHPILATQGFQRIQDYALQQQAAKLLHGKSRVCFCGKRKIDKLKNRSVVYNPTTERAYFSNVQRCGSIWDCKVCAKKITETRRKELAFANEHWKKGVVLQTFDYSEYPDNFIGPIRPTWEYVKGYTYLITPEIQCTLI